MVGLNLVSIRFVYMYGRPKLSEYTVCLHEGLNLVSIRFVYMYGRPKLSEYTVCLHVW